MHQPLHPIAATDWRLMISHPVLWASGVWRLSGIALVASTAYLLTLSLFPLSAAWARWENALALIAGGAALLSAVVSYGWLPKVKRFPVPKDEQLAGGGADRWPIALGEIAAVLCALLALPAGTWIVRDRLAGVIADVAMLRDMDALNAGIRSCCALFPSSPTCLAGSAFSKQDHLLQLRRGTSSHEPSARANVGFAEGHEAKIAGLEALVGAYRIAVKLPGRNGVHSFRRQGLADLDRPIAPDLPGPQRTCQQFNNDDFSAVASDVDRIVAAKQWRALPVDVRLGRIIDVLVALILLVAAAAAGLPEGQFGVLCGLGCLWMHSLFGLMNAPAMVDAALLIYCVVMITFSTSEVFSKERQSPRLASVRAIVTGVGVVAGWRIWSDYEAFSSSWERITIVATAIGLFSFASELYHEIQELTAAPE